MDHGHAATPGMDDPVPATSSRDTLKATLQGQQSATDLNFQSAMSAGVSERTNFI